MINKIPYTSYSGQAGALCSKGNAVEFLQPWYARSQQLLLIQGWLWVV